MDHHCVWIGNCIGHRNLKYFMQFTIYTCVAAAYLALLMAISFYQLLTARKPKQHMSLPSYKYAFLASILAFVMGLIFAYFTWELCQEHLDSVEENQSSVDSLKKQFGAQQEFFDLCKVHFGSDVYWWMIPVHPELRTNYFERVWSKKEIRAQRKSDQYERDADDSDSDKKMFS